MTAHVSFTATYSGACVAASGALLHRATLQPDSQQNRWISIVLLLHSPTVDDLLANIEISDHDFHGMPLLSHQVQLISALSLPAPPIGALSTALLLKSRIPSPLPCLSASLDVSSYPLAESHSPPQMALTS